MILSNQRKVAKLILWPNIGHHFAIHFKIYESDCTCFCFHRPLFELQKCEFKFKFMAFIYSYMSSIMVSKKKLVFYSQCNKAMITHICQILSWAPNTITIAIVMIINYIWDLPILILTQSGAILLFIILNYIFQINGMSSVGSGIVKTSSTNAFSLELKCFVGILNGFEIAMIRHILLFCNSVK